MRHAVVITARGNNQSIPDKNVLEIAGKPSLAWGIEAAQLAHSVSGVYVSTDDAKIADVARRYGCTILERPAELALPTANHGDVIRHATREVKRSMPDLGNVTILLGNTIAVTSGLIDLSNRILEARAELDSVMSVWQAQDDHPYRALKINERGTLESFLNVQAGTNRQSYPPVYFYDQGVWTFRHGCVERRDGPSPWWWMGKNSFPIVRRWVTGRDYHSQLDIDYSEFWIRSKQQDVIENQAEIDRLLGSP